MPGPGKNEIVELNVNWRYVTRVSGLKPEPIATVDFKIKMTNPDWKKSYIMIGHGLTGDVEVVEDKDKDKQT